MFSFVLEWERQKINFTIQLYSHPNNLCLHITINIEMSTWDMHLRLNLNYNNILCSFSVLLRVDTNCIVAINSGCH